MARKKTDHGAGKAEKASARPVSAVFSRSPALSLIVCSCSRRSRSTRRHVLDGRLRPGSAPRRPPHRIRAVRRVRPADCGHARRRSDASAPDARAYQPAPSTPTLPVGYASDADRRCRWPADRCGVLADWPCDSRQPAARWPRSRSPRGWPGSRPPTAPPPAAVVTGASVGRLDRQPAERGVPDGSGERVRARRQHGRVVGPWTAASAAPLDRSSADACEQHHGQPALLRATARSGGGLADERDVSRPAISRVSARSGMAPMVAHRLAMSIFDIPNIGMRTLSQFRRATRPEPAGAERPAPSRPRRRAGCSHAWSRPRQDRRGSTAS